MSTDFVNLLTKASKAAVDTLPPEHQQYLFTHGPAALKAAAGTLTTDQRHAVRDLGRALKGLCSQFGDDPTTSAIVHREFGVSFLKKLSRVAKKVGKAVVKSPIVKGAAGIVAMVYPPVGVPLTAALAVASKAVSMANSADKKVKAVGLKLIKGTVDAARKGNPDAARAVTLLRQANAESKLPPTKRLERQAAKEQVLRKQLGKASAVDKAVRYKGFIVTTQGRIYPGNQLVKISGDYK